VDFRLSSELQALSNEAHEVGKMAAAQQEIREDSWLVGTSREFSQELAARNWLGMTWPVEQGGGGRTALERFIVFEALIAEGAPVATSWFADRQIGPTLLQFGTQQQRDRWLPDIISGTSAWCIGMSEPAAGSDVAALQTSAVRVSESDGAANNNVWRVNGQKVWTSGAAQADWCYLIARTDPTAPPHAGLSEFVIDMTTPGIEVRPILDATGNAHFCEVFFTDVQVPADHLVGTLNGSFKQVMRQMEHERGGIDRLVSNRALYLDAVKQADMSDPRIRDEFAALESGYTIGRLLVLREVLQQAPAGFSAATKTLCTEFEQRVAEFCVRVAGAEAMCSGRVARNICYAPAYTIMGGTTNILRNIVAERMLGLPKEPAKRYS
jgi:alkylation response protein AidB-like acyl-CoA dehydrogenase